jgi:hypothetical protein
VLCEPFPLLQVALRATVPCFAAVVLFLHPTSLGDQDFPVLQYCIVLQGLHVLVPKPGWLALFLPKLVEGKLRLYQRFGGVELAHLLVLVFLLTEAQWRLRGWTVVPVAPLGAHP